MQKKPLRTAKTLHDRTFHKLGNEENFLNLIMYIHKNHTANVMHNGEILNACPLNLGSKTRMSDPPIYIQHYTKDNSQGNYAKRNKRH